MLKIWILSTMVAVAVSMPAKEVLDKATVNDVSLNDVNADKKVAIDLTVPPKDASQSDASIDIIIDPSTTVSSPTLPSRPHGGSAFARIIDDIFQIPITVLQSVSRLLTNPFIGAHKTQTPETASGY